MKPNTVDRYDKRSDGSRLWPMVEVKEYHLEGVVLECFILETLPLIVF